MKILVVRPNKNPIVKEIGENLESMQAVVDGYIQVIYPWDDNVAVICNEKGKLRGLPWNRFIAVDGQIIYRIAGTFFLCLAPPESENFQDLPDDLIEKYSKQFELKEI